MNDHALSKPLDFLSANPLLVAIVAAIIVHLIPILSVQITKPEPQHVNRSIDITLVNAPSEKAPEKVEALAAENQLASGQQEQKPIPPQQAPTPKVVPPQPQEKPIPKVEPEKVKPKPQEKPIPKPVPEKVKPKPQEKPIPKPVPEKVTPKPQEKPIPNALLEPNKPKLLVQNKAEQKVVTSKVMPTPVEKLIETSEPEKVEPKVKSKVIPSSKQLEMPHHLSAASLQQQILEMGMQIRQTPASAAQTKIKTVNQVSANKYVAAQYLRDWETKVAGVGNRNYPTAAIKEGFSATLTMEVDIAADGSINRIYITRSSGNPELDEAAKNIVRMSAPFPPLPAALRKELDMLKIIRVWKFSDESGLITR